MGTNSCLAISTGQPGLEISIVRCDHCRGDFGFSVQRYWHMQFCSSACMTAYQQRLAPETKSKISRMGRSAENSQ